jgi:hypothetical protein
MNTLINLQTCVDDLRHMVDEDSATRILGIIEEFVCQRISFEEFQTVIRIIIPPHQFHLFPVVASLVELTRDQSYYTMQNNLSHEKDTVLKRLESLNIHFHSDKLYSQAHQLVPKPSKTSIASILNDENKNVDSNEAQWKEECPNADIYEDIKQFISSKPQLSSWLSCPSLPFSKTVPKLDVCGVSAKFNSSNVAPKLRSSFERPLKQKSRVRKEWTEAEDRAFLAGLKEFKLDFEKIAQMIPGRNKAQIRTHYKYLSKSLKHNLNATVKRRIKMRGRPPRGRPAVTPSNLMQEMQSCIEAIEIERAQQQRDGLIKPEDSDEDSLSSEIDTPSASPRSSFSTESPRSSGEHDLSECMMSE